MTHLPYLSILHLSGADVGSFLQAQLAADISSLGPGESTFAAYCSPRGQVIALLLVCRSQEDWFMVLESGLADAVANRLKMYVMRARVRIDREQALQASGVSPGDHLPPGALLYAPRQTALHYLLASPGVSAPDEIIAWQRHELCLGIAWLQPATSERFLPQMLGLETIGALSFTKGCFPGQEIVARARYLGKIKRHPLLLQLEGGAELHAGSSCFVLANEHETAAVAIAVFCPADPPCVALLVTALEETDRVTAVRAGDRSWPAQALQACATM